MTKKEAIREACAIMALAAHSINNFAHASDGFCDLCPAEHSEWNYQNEGHIFDYVRKAVLRQLKEDGHEVALGFNPITGKECSDETTSES